MSNSTLNTTGNLSPDDCSLTPRTRALNVLLTAITGPLIAGVSEGGFAALIQAGLTFGAMPRLFFYLGPFMYLALRMRPLKSRQFRPALRVLHRLLTCDTSPDNDPPNDLDDDDDDDNDDNNGNNDYIPLSRPVPQQTEQQRQTQYQHDVTLLGCVSWAYSALYAPTVATMWLIKNWKRSDISPWLKILKSFGFAATAGSSTVDTKNRYAMWLARRLGNWAGALFNLVSATGICLLATVFMILFTHSVADIFKSASINDLRTYISVMVFFLLSQVMASYFSLIPPRDRLPNAGYGSGFALRILHVMYALLVASLLPGILLVVSKDHPGVGLVEYWRCQTVSDIEKFVAIFP